MKCKVCGQDNPPEARFCANCGANLVAKVEELPSLAAAPSPLQVPRKWLLIGGLALLMVTGVVFGLALFSNGIGKPPPVATTPAATTTVPSSTTTVTPPGTTTSPSPQEAHIVLAESFTGDW